MMNGKMMMSEKEMKGKGIKRVAKALRKKKKAKK